MTKSILLVSPLNFLGERSSLPPLGLITNASYIPEKYDIRLIDESVDGKIDFNDIDANLVCISANTFNIGRAYEICTRCQENNIPTILGGIHPTVMPEEASHYATSVVIGNGEPVWSELLEDFEKNNLKKIYKPDLFDLSDSKIPRRDLLPKKYYFDSIQTSRGCPFDCKFCSATKLNGNKYRSIPVELIEKDINSIKKDKLFLVDDNFLGYGENSEDKTIKLLNILDNYNVRWIGQTSINVVDNAKILNLARKSGALGFYIGFESLNTGFLKSVKKSLNLKKGTSSYKNIISKIHDNGICVLGSFIYGTDYDTRDNLLRLRDFIVESNIDAAYIKPLTPLPGTDIYEDIKKAGRLFNNEYWLQKSYPIFTFQPKNLTMDQLIEITLEFLDIYRLSKSIKYFGKSILNTKNLDGPFLSFLSNFKDNREYKKYFAKFLQTSDLS
jgi:radical SAM superfamily enzyme YgiQ (UPF0313 family)